MTATTTPGVRLAIGSNAASVWWINRTEVIGIYNDRQTVIDDDVSRRLTLRKAATSSAPRLRTLEAPPPSARFLDEENRAVRGITVRLMER